MNTYTFKIKKKNILLTLKSNSPKLIAEEFAKFAIELAKNKEECSFESNIDFTETNLSATPEIQKKYIEQIQQETIEENDTTTFIEEIEPINTPETIIQEEIKTEIVEEITTKPTTIPNKLPANFANILAQKTKEESNVIEKRTSELKQAYLQMQTAIKEKNLKDEIDYIVTAAYCLSHYEGLQRFTEEQIKAKVAPFFDEELEHKYVLDAISKNLIKVLPDFTGFSDTIEFELTEYGEDYFLNEL